MGDRVVKVTVRPTGGGMVVAKPLHPGDPAVISTYRLVGRLGEGGMGVVYLAQNGTGKPVAVKVIRTELAMHEVFRARFRDEVANASRVARFCTAPILDADTDANPPYIVTEYIEGPTLSAAVAEHGQLTGSQLHALGVGIANALSAIHYAGVIHRDLKPGNVLLSRFGPQVIDFGIARAVDALGGVTQPGRAVGSPSYMAPEQLRGLDATPQVDIFAWGAVMAFAGTGHQPFGESTDAVFFQVLYGEANLDGLDPQLAGLVTLALDKDPARRPTAPQLLDALVRGPEAVPALTSPAPHGASALAPGPSLAPGPAGAPWLAAPRAVVAPGVQLPGFAPAGAGPAGPDSAAGDPAVAAVPPNALAAPDAGPKAAPDAASAKRPRPATSHSHDTGEGRWSPRPSRLRDRYANRRRGRRRLVVWLVLGPVLLLGCGAAALTGIFYFDYAVGRSGSISAVDAYLDNLRARRYDSAYDRLCSDVRSSLTREQFILQVSGDPPVTGYRVDKDSVPFGLSDSYPVEAQVRRAGRSPRVEKFVVDEVRRDGPDEYLVCPRGS